MSENEPENDIPIPFTAPVIDRSYIGDSNFGGSYMSLGSLNMPKSDYKISYTPTMESQIRKLRLSLENYRELIVQVNDTLLWREKYHPYAIIAGSTITFLLIWLSDPNVLTMLSFLGLLITIGDYVLPTIVQSLFKKQIWTNDKQKQYEEVCTNIMLYKTKFELLLMSYLKMRVTNPKLYFSITFFALLFLAWIGSVVNNLFLLYLSVLTILLLPGMVNHGMLNRGCDTLSKIFTDLVENAKSIGQKKKE